MCDTWRNIQHVLILDETNGYHGGHLNHRSALGPRVTQGRKGPLGVRVLERDCFEQGNEFRRLLSIDSSKLITTLALFSSLGLDGICLSIILEYLRTTYLA